MASCLIATKTAKPVRKVEKATNSEPLKGEDQLFHPHAQWNASHRRDAHPQSRLFGPSRSSAEM
jgi:hypothetical protein